MTQTKITDYAGFELAIGSVLAVRWFDVDSRGRLRGKVYDTIWKPGENVAKCRKDDEKKGGGWYVNFPSISYSFSRSMLTGTPPPALSESAVEARIDLSHDAPGEDCTCGFYAFAEGCDDGSYASRSTYNPWWFPFITRTRPTPNVVAGVVECYGRTVIGTRGLRCEKARIVALATKREDVKRLYPDADFFANERRMLRGFDLAQPFELTPETDPNFWGAA